MFDAKQFSNTTDYINQNNSIVENISLTHFNQELNSTTFIEKGFIAGPLLLLSINSTRYGHSAFQVGVPNKLANVF